MERGIKENESVLVKGIVLRYKKILILGEKVSRSIIAEELQL